MERIVEKQKRVAAPAFRPMRKTVSHVVVSGSVQFFDYMAILVAGAVAYLAYLVNFFGNIDDFDRYVLTSAFAAIVFVAMSRWTGSYEFARLDRLTWQLRRAALIWAATLSFLTTLAFVSKAASVYSRGWAITFGLLVIGELIASRAVLHLLFKRWRTQGRLTRLVAIVGGGQDGEELIQRLASEDTHNLFIAGVFDDRTTRIPQVVGGYENLGTVDDLVRMAQAAPPDEIIIALPLQATDRIGEIVAKLRALPVDLRLSLHSVAGAFPISGIGHSSSVPVVEIADRPLKDWNGIAKNLIDKSLCVTCLVGLAPLFGLIALAIKVESRGPVFFVQQRFGFNNQIVRVLKFRTMYTDRGDPSGAARTVRNDPRVTKVGRWLRRWSFDELPQLINVFLGEMSLVGPRAHAVAMIAGDKLYHDAVEEYARRHRVRPGITGWAQVNGSRGEIDTIEKARERVEFDLYYIDHWSPWLDAKILFLTAMTLLRRHNAY